MPDTDPFDEIACILDELVPAEPAVKYGRIYETFYAANVSPEHLDELLANGWRHFAESFYRYDRTLFDGSIREVMPLRIKLSDFVPSKSQRRILKRNCDLEIALNPAEIDEESVALFRAHRERFKSNAPNSLYDYLSVFGPAERPSPVGEMRVHREKKLVAVSYFDIGRNALSGVYAMFDPSEACRSLGTFTMLKEIEHAIETGRKFYYQGYAYQGESFYDYKKRFRGTQVFDWREGWEPI
jgi:leucyl-tRNA---protein transferase